MIVLVQVVNDILPILWMFCPRSAMVHLFRVHGKLGLNVCKILA